MKALFLFCWLFSSFVFSASTTEAWELRGKPRVIDGDTIVLANQRIRLHGIDAPESKQKCMKADGSLYPCGTMATFALAEMVGKHWVNCTGDSSDRYNRLIATCNTGPVNLNREMVRLGWALAYRQYSSNYIAVEAASQAKRLGLWQGAFIKPWQWRRGVRLKQSPSSTPKPGSVRVNSDCKIKGNISRSGTRIFHRPDSRYYANTRINISAGERWFCSEEEAIQAGWRPAK
jgi:endonuclease YncB( thermonuclease family)